MTRPRPSHPGTGPTPAGFDDLALTCCHVRLGERPVEFVSHHAEGWTFTCGRGDHYLECWGMAHTYHFTDVDPSLSDIAELRVGGQAVRLTADSGWLLLPDL